MRNAHINSIRHQNPALFNQMEFHYAISSWKQNVYLSFYIFFIEEMYRYISFIHNYVHSNSVYFIAYIKENHTQSRSMRSKWMIRETELGSDKFNTPNPTSKYNKVTKSQQSSANIAHCMYGYNLHNFIEMIFHSICTNFEDSIRLNSIIGLCKQVTYEFMHSNKWWRLQRTILKIHNKKYFQCEWRWKRNQKV